MSTIDAMDAHEQSDLTAPARMPGGPLPRIETPIVPKATIAGRALVAVVAIMTFLASLTIGAVLLIYAAAGDWQADVAREVTIQIRPASGRDIDADVDKAAGIARGFPGIAEVRPYSKEESARLLEPWLGTGLALGDLPLPRLIVVRLAPGATPDFAQLRKTLSGQVPGASLDDHRGFVDRMRAMAHAALAGGLAILALVMIATMLSVTFATRGAMAANRPVIEVLHFVGAKDGFIAGHFQRHFLVLGLKGGVIGGGGAIVLFALAEALSRWLPATAGSDQLSALFGQFSIGWPGYVAVLAQIILIAIVTAVTSRRTVNRTLETVQ
jgi:cell division transport system permease protein